MHRIILLLVGLIGCTIADKLSSTEVGLPADAHVAAFGDFNSDLHTDAFAVSNDLLSVRLYLWNHAHFTFERSPLVITETSPILNVAGGDFNYDGKLDVFVSGRTNDTACATACYWMHIYYGYTETISSQPFVVLPRADDQVLIMDANNDLRPDLFGASQGVRQYWINNDAGDYAITFTAQPQTGAVNTLKRSGSHAFVDFDGDCRSDLFVSAQSPAPATTHVFEIWLNVPNEGFKLSKSFTARDGAGTVTFADLDADGTMDLLFPVCQPADTCADENSIHIFYNQQKPMCSSIYSSSSSCRAQNNLCSADPDFAFDADMSSATGSASHVVAPVTPRFVNQFSVGGAANVLPITLRTGDIDLDGYADLLIPLQDASGNRVLTIWHNVECGSTCTGDASNAGRRTFERMSDVDSLQSLAGAYAGAFFDLNDAGSLGVIALYTADARSTNASTASSAAYLNEFNEDAYFLTTLGSNGVCPAWCSSGEKFPDPKPYGVNFPGASVKFTVTSIEGSKSPRQGAQLSQSSHLALQTPYNLFGLGRTNNYIEQFYVGFPLPDTNYQMWVTIIPNSQLVIFPYPPSDPASWTMELFISPSSRLLWVGVSLACTCVVLIITIAVLQWRERKQDDAEKTQTQHLFAF